MVKLRETLWAELDCFLVSHSRTSLSRLWSHSKLERVRDATALRVATLFSPKAALSSSANFSTFCTCSSRVNRDDRDEIEEATLPILNLKNFIKIANAWYFVNFYSHWLPFGVIFNKIVQYDINVFMISGISISKAIAAVLRTNIYWNYFVQKVLEKLKL